MSGKSRLHRGLAAFPWAIGFGLCALPVFLGLLNHDSAWMLLAADRVLDGRTLYVDVIEVNPPLIIWFGFAPVLGSRVLGISQILSFRLTVLGVLAGSLLLSRWTLARGYPERPDIRRLVLLLAMVALLPLAGYEFGQREHLMVALFLPYLLLASARAKGLAMGRALPWAVGLAAGVGIAFKPHFVLPWLAVEIHVAVTRRNRLAWLRPEVLAVTIVGLAFVAAVLMFAPEYLAMARWALPLYAKCVPVSFASLLGQPATVITAFAALGVVAVRPRGELRELCRLLLVADLGLLAIAFVQDKGFSYHFYPAMALGTILIGLLAAGPDDPGDRRAFFPVLAMRGVLAILLLNASAARVGDSLVWQGNPAESDTTIGRMARLSRECSPSGSVFTFSPAVGASFPMVFYGEVGWASRYPCLHFLTGFYPDGRTLPAKSPAEMGRIERDLLATVVGDLIEAKPALLFVDEMEEKPAFQGGRFDFLEYYALDPRFPGFLSDYERTTRADMFGVYRRKDASTTRAGSPPDQLAVSPGEVGSWGTGRGVGWGTLGGKASPQR